jgi:hypothetical protein
MHNAAMSDVMEKLVLGFERYTKMLAQMRSEEGDLLGRLRRGDRLILERVMSEEREERILEETQDQLLEAISEYQRTRSDDSRSRVAELVRELEQIKPGFVYDLDRLDAVISSPGFEDLDLADDLDADVPGSTQGKRNQGGDGYDRPRLDAA